MNALDLYLDDSYDDRTDIYVMAGVVVAHDRVYLLDEAIADVALRFTGSRDTELRFARNAELAEALGSNGYDIADLRRAMATVPGTVGGITLVASIIDDPSGDPNSGSLKPLTWALQRCIGHFANHLADQGSGPQPAYHAVIADQFHRGHETDFLRAYRDCHLSRPFGRRPRDVGMQAFMTVGDATFARPLQMADSIAGAVRSWAMTERRYDAMGGGPRAGKETGLPRSLMRTYLPCFRSSPGGRRVAGFGISAWPDALRPEVDLWLARLRGERMEEVFQPFTVEYESEGGRQMIRLIQGTRRAPR